MEQRHYTIRFNTPAFLGNADQCGQWRGPPFKALLRQWWRVAYASQNGFNVDVAEMRREEAQLFGLAADGNGVKSLVRIKLGHWNPGKMHRNDWVKDLSVRHPDVERPVGSQLYMGYGPLGYDKKNRVTKLNKETAIEPGETAVIKLAFPRAEAESMDAVHGLMHRFATIGGRSRNGWGSFELLQDGQAPSGQFELSDYLVEWREALQRDWPHAIGKDGEGALLWRTRSVGDWKKILQELAKIKIGLRTSFDFHSGNPASHPEQRHWLSYPVTHHSVMGWNNKRLPNTLRFKIRRDENGELYAVIFHMPCKPPRDFQPDDQVLIKVWSQVHGYLDQFDGLNRSVK